MIKLVGNFVAEVTDKIFDKLWPLEVHLRSYLGMWDEDSVDRGPEQLSKHEETCEVCEPKYDQR
jgi:hypothetical protein